MPLDEWQEQALEAAMGERQDGRWASKFVGLSVPRQNGKSQIIVARALAGVLLFGEKMIIISAHETDTAREVWKRLIDVVEDNPTLEARVTGRMDAINREFLSFGKGANKQTIKLKARRAGGSRGFSADCLLLDEAQILGKRAWGSIVPTMSARANPQAWLFGTPPTEDDDPFAFSRVRKSSIAKKVRHCWLEWSADPDDDFDDPATWAKANPSYGVRISEEACADDRAAMDDEQFALERLGMWEEVGQNNIIRPSDWAACRDTESQIARQTYFALDVSPLQSWAAIGVCGAREDGLPHVEVIEHRESTSWVVPRMVELDQRWPNLCVYIAAGSAAVSLVPDLKDAGLTVEVMPASDAAPSCGHFYDAATSAAMRHMGQPVLDAALSAAARRNVGDGAWAWGRRKSTVDITALYAVTTALWAFHTRGTGDITQAIW
jgi:phage terminase large subunit-like protein